MSANARRGSRQEKRLLTGNASDVLYADISFREPISAIQVVHFTDTNSAIRAYSIYDLIAEKLRVLLQKEVRNRYRRQYIHDIGLLLVHFSLDDRERFRVHKLLLVKAAARNIVPRKNALACPETWRRARLDWDSLALEIGIVPSFEDCYERVDAFYRSLPWSG